MIVQFPEVLTTYAPLVRVISLSLFANITILCYYNQASLPVFAEIMTIFVTISKSMFKRFKKELELFYEKVVFQILGNISVCRQIELHLREQLLLQSLLDILHAPSMLELMFRNYDCDVYSLNLVSILFKIVSLPFTIFTTVMTMITLLL